MFNYYLYYIIIKPGKIYHYILQALNYKYTKLYFNFNINYKIIITKCV